MPWYFMPGFSRSIWLCSRVSWCFEWSCGRLAGRWGGRSGSTLGSSGIFQTSLHPEHLPGFKLTGPVKLNCVVTGVLENLGGWGSAARLSLYTRDSRLAPQHWPLRNKSCWLFTIWGFILSLPFSILHFPFVFIYLFDYYCDYLFKRVSILLPLYSCCHDTWQI